MSALALPADIAVEERLGDTWRVTINFLDVNGATESHAGSTWRGQIKTAKASASSFASFTVDTTNAATGIIISSLAAATTATATVDTLYYWEIEETAASGDVITHLAGTVVWRQDVARA